ncbi:hypothetical protein CYLTODRAFT_417411 [Cylindrobasidium torrendii FP15055 ss-10]|uniref:DCG1-like protein n=1 Tax=Cylindrobasidium torrendii FP15055 ss-10 TaxID=1314674 RepID=A0A0D7BR40_9AGAR|nr:hypothetical protein CYLTODRAFT_417411 [Cylindrobasidium torrendii FP15055 ss-10]
MSAQSSNHVRILVVNPNTSEAMTAGLKPIVQALHEPSKCDFFTSPIATVPTMGCLSSIDSAGQAVQSALYVLPFIQPFVAQDRYDAYLVACYSEHPLVDMLASLPGTKTKIVTGIFEASIMASLGTGKEFGIVTTGDVWKEKLTIAVNRFMGLEPASMPVSTKFAGVATTGMTAGELHSLDQAAVRARISLSTADFVREHTNVRVLCMGCAGMVGLEAAIRKGVVDALGSEKAKEVRIIDGVAAGVKWILAESMAQ